MKGAAAKICSSRSMYFYMALSVSFMNLPQTANSAANTPKTDLQEANGARTTEGIFKSAFSSQQKESYNETLIRSLWIRDQAKMSRATTISSRRTGWPASRHRPVVTAAAAVVALIIILYVLLATLFPASVDISPALGSTDVPVGQQLQISASWLRGTINSVAVKEVPLDPAGASTGAKQVEGHLENGLFMTPSGPLQFKPDTRYEVTVNASLLQFTLTGPHHRQVTEQDSFQTITTPAPIFSQGEQVVPIGEPIVVEFNTPISSFSYHLNPDVQTTSSIDGKNPTRAYIKFSGAYQEGQKFDLTITAAVGKDGIPLKQPYTQKIATTDPLKVEFVPGDGEAGVSQGERPTLTFSENIRNPDDAQKLVSVDPAIPGAWNWVEPNKLEFKPSQEFSQAEKITIHLKGGQDGLRGVSGSFLREDVQSTFTVQTEKVIDVNLAEQRVRAYDNGHLVKTIICSSGSKATPSLTGTYAVYAKSPAVDMSGPGYFAPHVPWVLMFNGDYTIHGNYWATRFGVPTSHGCVGLPPPDAQWLYNWTPIGTIIKIHY